MSATFPETQKTSWVLMGFHTNNNIYLQFCFSCVFQATIRPPQSRSCSRSWFFLRTKSGKFSNLRVHQGVNKPQESLEHEEKAGRPESWDKNDGILKFILLTPDWAQQCFIRIKNLQFVPPCNTCNSMLTVSHHHRCVGSSSDGKWTMGCYW